MSQQDIIAILQQAAEQYGANPKVLVNMAKLESGFRTGAVNNYDSNAQKGTPSEGVLQFIRPTFDSFARQAKAANPGAWNGVNMNWLDPKAQALAASWAITHGHSGDWTTYKRAVSASGGAMPTAGAMSSLGQPTGLSAGGGLSSLGPAKLSVLSSLFNEPGKDNWFSDYLSKQATVQPQPTVPMPTSGSPSVGALSNGLPKGIGTFNGRQIAEWIVKPLEWARQHGWNGTITSGYRSPEKQAALYANRGNNPNPVARPGTSNHEMTAFPGGAVDVTDAQRLSELLAHSPYAGLLQWAGSKDPVHFSHPHNGTY